MARAHQEGCARSRGVAGRGLEKLSHWGVWPGAVHLGWSKSPRWMGARRCAGGSLPGRAGRKQVWPNCFLVIFAQKLDAKNTGIPGDIKGYSKERVIHSPAEGVINNISHIADYVEKGQIIAKVGSENVYASLSGILRGIIYDKTYVKKGLKIADIDPRKEELQNCYKISDKARCIGGGVLEALLNMCFIKNIKIFQ